MTDLWPQQVEALGWINNHRRSWLQVPMSGGKSRIVFEAIAQQGYRRVLVLCPSRVVDVWPREGAKWAPDYRVLPLRKGTSTSQRATQLLDHGWDRTRMTMAATNYEAILQARFQYAAQAFEPELVVLDECHVLKSPTGKLFKAVRKLLDATDAALIAMTGTAMPHGPEDVWAPSKLVDPDVIPGPYSRFLPTVAVLGGPQRNWIEGYRVDPTSPDYDPDIAQWLAAKLARILFTVEVPETIGLVSTFATHPLPPDVRKLYDQLYREWAIDLGEAGYVAPPNALVRLLRLAQLASGELPLEGVEGDKLWHNQRFETLVETLEAANEPVVVGCRFRHELAFARDAAEALGRSYGEISGARSDGLNDRAEHAGQDVIGVQYQAGGVGIDLSYASLAVLVGHQHNLGLYDQFVKRLRRHGQEADTVRVVHLLAEDTVDMTVYEALSSRRDVVTAVTESIREGHQ